MTRARFWNVWWTLTVISAALTMGVALREALGVLRDLGIVLSIMGLLVTMSFGLTASTRSSLSEFRGDVVPRLVGIEGRLDGIDSRLGGIDGRLDGLAERLDRIIALLDERLPRPAAWRFAACAGGARLSPPPPALPGPAYSGGGSASPVT